MLERGAMLSHFRLIEQIGEGGMGVVWRALDTTLGREVAIKILPEAVACDPDRVSRFEREARTLASLSHPNVVTIHSVEEDRGIRFLTMELVHGKPLTQLLQSGGLLVSKIFDVGVSLASALAAAHEKGIVHRDLKPANVMLTSEGEVKVLDFGLAKLRLIPDETTLTGAEAETMTAEGRVVGTFPYMSPEQIQARPLDHRSDIFSLGVILHEMATGSRPFQGRTAAELMSSILRDAPASVTDLRPELPAILTRVIRRCLEKDPSRRYQSALDVRNELDDLKKEIESEPVSRSQAAASARQKDGMRRWWIAGAGVIIVTLAALLTFGPLREWFAGKPYAGIRSLAVLPLNNLMGDEGQDYFV